MCCCFLELLVLDLKSRAARYYHAGARLYDPEVPRFYGGGPACFELSSSVALCVCPTNPLLYIDPAGRDYVLHFDEKDQSITVTANYYTTETGAASAREAMAFWIGQGKYLHKNRSRFQNRTCTSERG